MMTDVETWSAWDQREYCGCDRVRSVCGLSFSFSSRLWEGVKLVVFCLHPRRWPHPRKLCSVDARRFRLLQVLWVLFVDCFCSCRSVRSLMIASTCSRVFLDGLFMMDLVSSVVPLRILSAWVIFWRLDDVVIKLDSVRCALRIMFLSTLLCGIGNVSWRGRHTMH